MNDKTAVNGTITDAVTATNVQVVASSPAVAMGSLYSSLSNSMAMASLNAVYAQQQTNILHQTVTAKLVADLLE